MVEAIDDSATAGLSARSRPGAERIQEINQQLEGDREFSEAERQALIDERTAILVLRDKRNLALEKACHYYAGSREACQFERSLLYYEFQTWGDLSDQDQEIYRYYHQTATLWADGERDRITDIGRQALSDIVIDTLTAPVVIGKIAGQALMGDEESQALLREMGDELKAFVANPAAHISESNREQLAYADALEQAGQRGEADLVRMRVILENHPVIFGAQVGSGVGAVKLAADLPKWLSRVVKRRNDGDGNDGGGSAAPNSTLTNADFPEVNARLSSQRQARHIENGIDPRTGQPVAGSVMRSQGDAQQVLDAYRAGDATVIGQTQQGFPVVRYNGVTGINNNPGAGFVNQETNVFIIKGTSSPSIVPTNPNFGK